MNVIVSSKCMSYTCHVWGLHDVFRSNCSLKCCGVLLKGSLHVRVHTLISEEVVHKSCDFGISLSECTHLSECTAAWAKLSTIPSCKRGYSWTSTLCSSYTIRGGCSLYCFDIINVARNCFVHTDKVGGGLKEGWNRENRERREKGTKWLIELEW